MAPHLFPKRLFSLIALAALALNANAFVDDDNNANPVSTNAGANDPDHIQWGPLLSQSLFFLGIENGFRLGTQDYTRDALHGRFFNDWGASIGNLHGWGDGDPFLTNYVGHPMEGSVTGFILVQNDLAKYKYSEFGRNRNYWKSRARAALFAFASSTEFELGPISEASIGNTSLYFPQQGLADHAITPSVGFVWMIAEDAVDKYLVERFEQHSDKRWVKMLMRSGLNPSRSMANALRLQVPWHRDTRPGIFRNSLNPVSARNEKTGLLSAGVAPAAEAPPPKLSDLYPQLTPRFELGVRYSYMQLAAGQTGSLSCNGGGATTTYNFTSWFGLTADVGGCKMVSPGVNISGDSTNYLAGPRITFRRWAHWTPHVQFLVGGDKLTIETMYPERKPANLPTIPAGDPNPYHSLYTSQAQTNNFAIEFGGGLEYALNRVVALQLLDVEDVHLWARTLNGRLYPDNIRASTGIVLHFGTW